MNSMKKLCDLFAVRKPARGLEWLEPALRSRYVYDLFGFRAKLPTVGYCYY